MTAVTRYLLLLALLSHLTTDAQIRVEILSRTDSFAFLGSGSDNRVRIHNLPKEAVVSIYPGVAINVKDSEYVLCRFGGCEKTPKSATLKIIDVNKKPLFTKQYKILFTPPSGSAFNPLLHISFGRTAHHQISMSVADFDRVSMSVTNFITVMRNNDFFISSDTSIKVDGLTLSQQPLGKDYVGPYNVGQPYTLCGFENLAHPQPRPSKIEMFKRDLEYPMSQINVHPGDRVFFTCIRATGKEGGVYTVANVIVQIR